MATLVAMATVHEIKKSNETTGLILFNFIFSISMMVIQDYGKKVVIQNSKFKRAVMPIYGKNHSNDFSRTTGPIWPIFCRKHMGHLPI